MPKTLVVKAMERGTFMYVKYGKRAVDFGLALAGLIGLGWLLVLLALLVRLTSPGPALFRQRRIGRNKKEFEILKFRTMRIDTPRDMPTHLLTDPERYVTPLGRWLRRTSLDELPQLFNILKGEMALIGPRPALWNQFDLIAGRELYGVNRLRPGLTGWAQVNGRDEIPLVKKIRLDAEYAKRISLRFDLKIFFMTAGKVITGEGIKG